jgi:hypothetical protein
MAQERLRDLKRDGGSEITIFCSHDAKELEAMQGLSGGHDRTHVLAPETVKIELLRSAPDHGPFTGGHSLAGS